MITNENGRGVEIVEVADVLNPELPTIDGTKVRISFGETIPTVQFGNIRPEISIEIPTQRKLIRKAIQSGYAFLELLTQRDNARSRLHAWAEPIFSLIEIGDQPDFFKLKQTEFGVIWG